MDPKGGLLALCNSSRLLLLNPGCLPQSLHQSNQFILEESITSHKALINKLSTWIFFDIESQEYKDGFRVEIPMDSDVKHVSFHEKGDYLATVCPNAQGQNNVVLVHSLQKGATQRPFNKSKGGVQKVCFHPNKPFLFILTQKNTYIYNLQKQVIMKYYLKFYKNF